MDTKARQQLMEQFFEALRVLRVPWIVTLLAVAVLVLPDQVRDIYRSLAENLQTKNGTYQIAFSALTMLVAAFLAFYVARRRAAAHLARVEHPGNVLRATLALGPPVCGALLIAGTALGMFLATRDVSGIAGNIGPDFEAIMREMRTAARLLTLGAIATAGLGAVFLASTCAWALWRGSQAWSAGSAFGRFVLVVSLAVAAFMVAVAFAPSVSVLVSQQMGSLAIFFLFVSVLLVMLGSLQVASDRYGIPLILLLFIWMLALTAIEGGNMHRVASVQRPKDLPENLNIGERFREWLTARKDLDAFRGQPYPVYLVSAEAGGLYAAQFTAKVLARIQDQCPNFAQHVFAVSGVSGGSLGAAMFTSLVKAEVTNGPWRPCNLDLEARPKAGPLEAKVDTLLDRDFLAPIVSRALFGDLLQHIVPVSLAAQFFGFDSLAQLSRGRALEESIEDAWARSGGRQNPFSRPFLEHWSPADAGPALLINTTNVEDGRSIVIAPFRGLEAGSDVAYLHANSLPQDKDITLGAAVGLSGRFPWVLPPATLPGSPLALVDGAYFESSGLETLRTVRQALQPFEQRDARQPIKVHVIVIGSQEPEAASKAGMLDEATPPVRAMLNARLRRGYSVRNAYIDDNHRLALLDCQSAGPIGGQSTGPAPVLHSLQIEGTAPASAEQNQLQMLPCSKAPEPQFTLHYERYNLPLGWKLSHVMRGIVEQHSRSPCLPLETGAQTSVDIYSEREIFTQNKRSEYLVAYSLTPIEVERSSRLLEAFTSKCR